MVIESDSKLPESTVNHLEQNDGSPELSYPHCHESHHHGDAKHSSTAETVESVRYILEEVLSYRLDAIRKRLIEQNNNDKYYRTELEEHIAMIKEHMMAVKGDNERLQRKLEEQSDKTSNESVIISKLNMLTLQNIQSLAFSKKILRRQMDGADRQYLTDDALSNENEVNLLKRLKLQNMELKAQLKQSQSHIQYLEESKIKSIISMSAEIQRLRQQIIDLSRNEDTASV